MIAPTHGTLTPGHSDEIVSGPAAHSADSEAMRPARLLQRRVALGLGTIVMQELAQRQAVLKLDQVDSHDDPRSVKRATIVCRRHRNPTKTG